MSVHDGGEGLGQIAVRFDAVQFAGFYEGGQNGPVLCPSFVTCEETVFATDGDGPDSAFEGMLRPPLRRKYAPRDGWWALSVNIGGELSRRATFCG
jgi:hypothetical protein